MNCVTSRPSLWTAPSTLLNSEASACASKNTAHLICLISTEYRTQHENAERRYKHWFCYCEWNWVIKLAPSLLTSEWMTPTPAASMAKFNLIYSVADAISAQSIKLRTLLCRFYGRHQWHRHRNDLEVTSLHAEWCSSKLRPMKPSGIAENVVQGRVRRLEFVTKCKLCNLHGTKFIRSPHMRTYSCTKLNPSMAIKSATWFSFQCSKVFLIYSKFTTLWNYFRDN